MFLFPRREYRQNGQKPTRRQSPDLDRPNMSDLRIVLLGKSLFENIRVRNFILGIDVMVTEDLQNHCVKISGMVENRHITLINCPLLIQPNFLQHQITERVRDFMLETDVMETEDYLQNPSLRIIGRVGNGHNAFIHCPLLLKPNFSQYHITDGVRECVKVSDPGPHVFILILQHQDFSEEDKHRVMHVLNCFSDQAMKRTIVLTTDEDTHCFIPSFVTNNEFIEQLMNECGGGHLHFNEDQEGWRSEMLTRVDEILKKEPEEYLKCDIYENAKAEGSSEEYSYQKDDGKPKERHEMKKDGGVSLLTGKSNLNVVLCGADSGLKVNISKLLQGKRPESYQTKFSSVCVERVEKIHGHQISVVELPSLSRLSEDEAMHQSLRCVSFCDPGVHLFLIIAPVGPLTDKDKAEVEKIQKMFYSSEHVMVIFTTDGIVDRSVTDFVESYPECKRLISLCGGRYKVIGLKEREKSKQTSLELLDYIKDMKTEPYTLQMFVRAQEMRVRDETKEEYEEKLSEMMDKIKELQLKINPYGTEEEQEDLKHLRIVLIGRTGNGKSATGNTILGRNQFKSKLQSDSVTTVCERGVCEVDGRSVAVVDTPGLFHTTLSNEEIQEEMKKCVSLSAPGPHTFIIVLTIGRFIREESETIGLIKKMFGPKAAQFSIILFTNADKLEDETIEDYVKRSKSAELQKLIRDRGDRYLAFNNNEKQDKTQVTKLIKMIEEMKTTNHGRYFTNSMFQEAEMSIKKRMEKILKEKEREIQAQKEELKAKYEMEMKNMMKRFEDKKRKADEERVQMENKYKEQEETLRKFEERQQREEEIQKRRLEHERMTFFSHPGILHLASRRQHLINTKNNQHP